MKMRIFRAGATLLIALASVFAAPAWAQFQSEGVIYAFTQMRVGQSQQYVLVPIASDQVRPDAALSSSVPTAFSILRAGKAATYGNTSLTFTDADATSGRAVVNVDPNVAPYWEVIAAETVYTFTQLGLERVVFPGFADDGLTRADIPYASYRFQVPLWQAIQAGSLNETDVVYPTGDLVDGDTFINRLTSGDAATREAILSYLTGDQPTPRYGVLLVVRDLEIPGYESAVLPSLQDGNPAYRRAALDALLGSSSSEAWDAVVVMMQEDEDNELRVAAAGALSEAPLDAYRFYEIVFRASIGSSPERLEALGAMSELSDDRVNPSLVGFLADEDPLVQQAAVDALRRRAAWSELIEVMDDDARDDAMQLAAASALATYASGAEQVAGLRYRGFSMTGEPANAVIDALAALPAGSREVVEEFLGHPDASVGVHAAGTLGARGEIESLAALAATVQAHDVDLDLRDASAEAAYRILAVQPFGEVQRFATNDNSFLRAAAYRALGSLAQSGQADAGTQDRLREGLTDPEPQIRAASARALATFQTPDALEDILTVADDPEPSVQGAVALALGSFHGESFANTVNPRVIAYIQSGEPEVVAGAVEALGLLGHTQLRGAVIDKVGYGDARVRAAAMRASVALADPASPRDVINALAGRLRDEVLSNRVLAARLLGEFSNENAVVVISQVLYEPEPELRYAAIDSLGRTQLLSAGSVLVGLLEDPNRDIRLAVIDALARMNLRGVVPELEVAVEREQDPTLRESIRGLIAQLNASGT